MRTESESFPPETAPAPDARRKWEPPALIAETTVRDATAKIFHSYEPTAFIGSGS